MQVRERGGQEITHVSSKEVRKYQYTSKALETTLLEQNQWDPNYVIKAKSMSCNEGDLKRKKKQTQGTLV